MLLLLRRRRRWRRHTSAWELPPWQPPACSSSSSTCVLARKRGAGVDRPGILLRRGHRRGSRRDSGFGERADTLRNLQNLQIRRGHPRDVFHATDGVTRSKRFRLVRPDPGGAHQEMLQTARAPRQGLILAPCAVVGRSVRTVASCLRRTCHALEKTREIKTCQEVGQRTLSRSDVVFSC